MARPKKDNQIRKDMCARFVDAMEQLGLSAAEAARALGYANATTIAKVQRGEAFVDVERLYLLAQMTTQDGRQIDMNWLICGKCIDDIRADSPATNPSAGAL
nr:transcriptional regulator [Luteibacter rhizovicinus]